MNLTESSSRCFLWQGDFYLKSITCFPYTFLLYLSRGKTGLLFFTSEEVSVLDGSRIFLQDLSHVGFCLTKPEKGGLVVLGKGEGGSILKN